jgi:hypothetical protein
MPVVVDTPAPQLNVDDFDAWLQPGDLSPALVTITRTSEADFKSRQLVVSIDGEFVAELLWGDSVTRELAPGRHRIRVHNTLVWKTVEFTLAPEEQIFFETVNRTGPGTLLLTLLLGVGPLYVTIDRM